MPSTYVSYPLTYVRGYRRRWAVEAKRWLVMWLANGEITPPSLREEVVVISYITNRKVSSMDSIELDYEPSILDCNMFCVYIGDLVKEISTGKIWTVDDIGRDFIIGKIGETTNYMTQSKFLWVATPKMPIGKGWK